MKTLLFLGALSSALIFGTIPAAAQTAALSISPTSVTLNTGDSATIMLSGGSSYYLSSNSSPVVASATLSGSTVVVKAMNPGTDTIDVCVYGSDGTVSCAGATITVLKSPTQPAVTSQTATISFGQNEINLNVGETKNVSVSGTAAGLFYVSNVTNAGVATATIIPASNAVSITGEAVGGANVTVCQFGGTCGNVYVYVPPTQANSAATQAAQITVPQLAAFYVASNDVGGFLGKGATLTLKFNTSEDISSKVVRVGGQDVQVNGTGSGPYSASYTISGNEPSPLSVTIDFWDAGGTAGHASFIMGDGSSPQTSASAQGSASASAGAQFTRMLSSGSIGSDVKALQVLLSRLGFYSGPFTGNFGPLTEAGVKRYQAARGIDQLGIVGPSTRAALNKE